MSIEKKQGRGGKKCRVVFRIPAELADNADSAYLLGDFNDWDPIATPMHPAMRKGGYKVRLKLKAGQEYEFRYLLDGYRWENDPDADGFKASPFGDRNSIVKT